RASPCRRPAPRGMPRRPLCGRPAPVPRPAGAPVLPGAGGGPGQRPGAAAAGPGRLRAGAAPRRPPRRRSPPRRRGPGARGPGARGATVVLAADGTPLRAFAGPDGVWRYPIGSEDVSPFYVEALLGYEDRWFHWHAGVNPVAMLRAAWQWAWHGRIVSGGSTLSMQVARILEPRPRSLGGKWRQTVRALQLEARLSKEEILEIYLNHAPFGGTIEGVEAASWAYLGKPSSRLSRAEAALLAVLP